MGKNDATQTFNSCDVLLAVCCSVDGCEESYAGRFRSDLGPTGEFPVLYVQHYPPETWRLNAQGRPLCAEHA